MICSHTVDLVARTPARSHRDDGLRLNSTTRARPDPRGPARTLSETRTDTTEFLGDPGRKKVRAGPVGSGRARVVEFSLYAARYRIVRRAASPGLPNTRTVTSRPARLYIPLPSSVLFCSLAVLDPRVGHTMHVLSPFIPLLCHSD